VTRLATALRAIRASRWGDIRDVAEAQMALLRAEAMRRLRPAGGLVDVTIPVARDSEPIAVEDAKTCTRLAHAVDRAARYGVFRPRCLARAVALSHMLDSRGIAKYRIRIGVRKEGELFTAHAWVELGDQVVGDTIMNTEGYVPLTDVSVNSSHRLTVRPSQQSSSRLNASIR
jgi:transglutaminase superfamily protein